MNQHEEKLIKKMCTWYQCENHGVFYHTDIDEPYGSPLLLCTKHDREYMDEILREFPDLFNDG